MFSRFICFLFRALLSLRYKITIKGLENLTPEKLKKSGGILFIPNHVSFIEPIILFSYLFPNYKMRPLAVEYMYRKPYLKYFMNKVKAISVPDFESSVNQLKIRRGEQAMKEIEDGLNKGDNFLVYPSGGLKSSSKEVLGGASGVHSILQKSPEANPVLIRITGCWGSYFSRAVEGRTPDFFKSMIFGIKSAFKNLIFFSPRRCVTVEIEPATEALPVKGTRIEFNRYLEDWFNRYPDATGKRLHEEPLNLVSYSLFSKKLLVPFNFQSRKKAFKSSAVSTKTQHDIYAEIRRILENPQVAIREEMSLATNLGMDSLGVGELMAFLTMKFDVSDLHPEDLDTVGSILQIAEGARAVSKPRSESNQFTWPKEPNRPNPVTPAGSTLQESFLLACDRMGSYSVCGDDLVGVMSYKKMKKSALVLAQYFKTVKGDRIAILLPASSAAFLTIMAVELAGKTPVMLNWTLGRRYLEGMMALGKADFVISSWRFLDKLSHVEFGDLTDKMLLLEDIRQSLSLKMKLKGLFLSFLKAKTILKLTGLKNIDPNSPSVILFTSGTEASPKGVPLSHTNILSSQVCAFNELDFNSNDVMYGILPPFHSFGFSPAGLLSILSGIRIAYYPDPTDSYALAEGVARWKVTLFVSAPTFLRGVLAYGKKEQLQSIRYFIVGAERTPPEIDEKIAQLGNGSRSLEGYGITECSPILTISPYQTPPKGVGKLALCVEACFIHPETQKLVPSGEDGEVCVRGPNVFSGYLGDVPSPFIEIDGKKWFRTGDIGHMDGGYLILSGRLKRFTKVGGEMISLGAVEQAIASELTRKGRVSTDAPSIAVCADERNSGKPQLVLFSLVSIDRDEANEILNNHGFSRLIKIGAVELVNEIPVLGTGKINHRKLQTDYEA